MTNQRELDRVLRDFFVEGTDELADRVIDAALKQIEDTNQRRPIWVPRRFSTMTLSTRIAAAAVIGVLAVGGALYLLRSNLPPVGSSSPKPGASPSPSVIASPPAGAYGWTSTEQMFGFGDTADTATRLADGRVLVTGARGCPEIGCSAGGPRVGATVPELFDPKNGSWTPTGQMNHERGSHGQTGQGGSVYTATLLPDGRVLVAGGSDEDHGPGLKSPTGGTLASVELYDLGTGSWTVAQPMIHARESFTATLLPDGKVLVAGGASQPSVSLSGTTLASAELYDPRNGTWTATGPMIEPRLYHTATLLPDGKVLVAGGVGGPFGDALASAELYDPATGSWTATGALTRPRASFTATLLRDGRVLIAGGTSNYGENGLDSAEIYDEALGAWTTTGRMTVARFGHTATLLPNGTVLVAGAGMGVVGFTTGSTELYDPDTGSWTATVPMSKGRTFFTATLLLDGRVLVAGSAPIAELYGPEGGS